MLGPLAYYDADFVHMHDATRVDRLWSLDTSDDANRHAKQDTSGNMPTVVDNDPDFGGHRSLVFGSANAALVTGLFSSVSTQPMTIYMVGKTGTGAAQFFFDALSTTNRGYLSFASTTTSTWFGANVNVGIAASTKIVYSAVVSGAASSVAINATTGATVNLGANNLGGLTIGNAYSFGYPLGNGKITSLAIYAGTHAATIRARLIKYWGAKYGITIT